MIFRFALGRLMVLFLLTCASRLPAQSFDLDRGREPLVSLDGSWHFHPGDSPVLNGAPVWAAPGYNDSAWPQLKSTRPWSEQGYSGLSGYAWYRFSVRVPPGSRPTSLLLAPIWSSYQIFVDGKLAGSRGSMQARIPLTEYSFHLFPLTLAGSPQARTIHVALRMWHPPIFASYVGGGPLRSGNLAGEPALLARERSHQQDDRKIGFVDSYSYSIIAFIVGIAILWLFLIRPGEREYLWFACMLLAQSADDVLFIGQQIYTWMPVPVYDLVDGALVAFNITALLSFFARVLGRRTGKTARIALMLAICSPPAAVLYWFGWASPAASASAQIALLLPSVLWVLSRLVECTFRGDLDARLLLVPTLLDLGFYFADNLAIVLDQAGVTSVPHIFEVPLPLPPFTVQTGTLLHLLFLLALLVFLIRRFTLARRQEERLAAEFEAARQVQQVLLPDKLDQCPGFHVESIYEPAEQVGGDFYQQISDGRCGMLIVVGDVSGKGLPAAMIVSVLVGAIRAEAAHGAGPSDMLSALNDRMIGRSQGGFVTCLAAYVTSGGLLTLASAGHLAPYLNGQEMPVSAAIPLGILAHQRYEASTLQLAPGDRLTFVSDGVIEAQSRSGELFGFERTRALSLQSAETIAHAARAFGQQDDITVVTVHFTGTATDQGLASPAFPGEIAPQPAA